MKTTLRTEKELSRDPSATREPMDFADRRETSQAQRGLLAGIDAQPQNRTGLPDGLKSGVERLSGLSLDEVRVHYNSSRPAGLDALAYTQETEIHIAPGQERYLPHEAWHVVQQKRGQVQPTGRVQGRALNADAALEREADAMGARAGRQGQDAAQTAAVARPIPAVLQMGGASWTPHHNRQKLGKLWESGNHAAFYTKDDKTWYVEAWVKKDSTWTYAGHVQLQPLPDVLVLHTTSEQGQDGGLSSVLMSTAIKKAAAEFGHLKEVQMTPAPGAASKKVIEMLSRVFGDQTLHAQAEEVRTKRKAEVGDEKKDVGSGKESKEARDKRLQTFDPRFLGEHALHLQALAAGKKTAGIKIMGTGGLLVGATGMEPVETPEERITSIRTREDVPGYGILMPMAKFKELAGAL